MSHRYLILLLFACLQFYNVKSGNAFYPESTFFTEDNNYFPHTSSTQSVKTVHVALLLPFGLKDDGTGESMGDRMVEYYEGFLLALKALKSKGISVNLQVYDIGSNDKEISNILKKEEMQNVHLIIGGVSDEQIKIISRFSNTNNIPYVIPFTSMSNELFHNPLAYQVNTPQPILYDRASVFFIDKYRNHRIFLVSGEKGASNQLEFTGLLRSDMQEKKISFQTISLKRFLDSDFISELDLYKDNVFVPDDDKPETIEKMITPLQAIQKNHPEYRISLFGYPRWQTCDSKYFDGFFQLHTSFFSVFYANLISREVKDFYNTFFKWYGRSISNNFPKFGMLGYDTGMYFIQVIHTYGTAFEMKINMLEYKGIQTDFYFERVNNWSGFINTNLFVIDYNPDYSITKTSIK